MWITTETPEELIPHLAHNIRVVENHDDICWYWLGPDPATIRRRLVKYCYPDSLMDTHVISLCDKPNCINPNHLAPRYSDAGNFNFIRKNGKQQGECLIWLGQIRDGRPTFPNSRSSTRQVILWMYEKIKEPANLLVVPKPVQLCKNNKCVEWAHFAFKQQNLCYLCEQPMDRRWGKCNECIVIKRGARNCTKGHFRGTFDFTSGGCFQCVREDVDKEMTDTIKEFKEKWMK